MITEIQNTTAYSTLEPFKQGLIIRRENRKKIEDAIITARNIGYETWAASSPMPAVWKNIVRELSDDSMELCTSCEQKFDGDTMATDAGENKFCPECWSELGPILQKEHDEMMCKCSVSIEDLNGDCEMCGKLID